MTIKVRGGLALRLGEPPGRTVEAQLTPGTVALLGEDYPGLRPVFAVEPGARVRAGTPLFEDRRRPELRCVAPIGGTVVEIARGRRRMLDRLVIAADDSEGPAFERPATLTREGLTGLLVQAGVWQSFRARPFERVPDPTRPPEAVFVTAMDTRPLAADPAAIIAMYPDRFTSGLRAVSLLSDGPTYLCHAAGADLPGADTVTAAAFSGVHPAGLAGTHIHHLHPVGRSGTVWHIGYQDIIAIGHLLDTGRTWTRRIVAVAGDGVARPALIDTVPGADLRELCRDRLTDHSVRLLTGSPLDGRPEHYLARYHVQASGLRHHTPEGQSPGWLAAAWSWLVKRPDAIMPNAAHERVAPAGILPIPFLRAVSTGDVETARRLGALELAEEDLALLAHVDGGGTDFGVLLRRTLDQLEAEQ